MSTVFRSIYSLRCLRTGVPLSHLRYVEGWDQRGSDLPVDRWGRDVEIAWGVPESRRRVVDFGGGAGIALQDTSAVAIVGDIRGPRQIQSGIGYLLWRSGRRTAG